METTTFELVGDPQTRKPSKVKLVFLILFTLLLILSIVFIVLYVVNKTKTPESGYSQKSSATNICNSPACIASAADILNKFDQSTKPCDDFYQFSCGGFVKNTFVKDGQMEVGSFAKAASFIKYFLKDRLGDENLMSNYSKDPDSAVYKAFKFYNSCVDESAILRAGVQPLLNMIEKYGSWNITNQNWTEETWKLEKVLARMQVDLNTGAFLKFNVVRYPLNTSQIFVSIAGGTSARSRNLDRKDELRRVKVVMPEVEESDGLNDVTDDAYKEQMLTAFDVLARASSINRSVDDDVERIIKLESEFAEIKDDLQLDPEALQDITKFMTLEELNSFTSLKFNWTVYLDEAFRDTGISIRPDQTLWIMFPDNIKEIVDFITSQPKSLLANEIMWNAIRGLLGVLPKSFIESDQKQVETSTDTIPRWEKCSNLAKQYFTHITTLLYVREHVSDYSVNLTSKMFTEIKSQFIDGLKEQEWMDHATRAGARLKLQKMKGYIGYPSIVKDSSKLNEFYKDVEIHMFRYVQNLLNLFRFLQIKKLKFFGEPPEDVGFSGSPLQVDASYSASTNALVINAGIMQPSFYRDKTLNALNYGALGMVVGHEITHGFDREESLFDENGSYRLWWTKKSRQNFLARLNCLIKQYSKIHVDGGLQINGSKTVSENIADNGGIKYAFRAYQKWREIHGSENKLSGLPYNNNQLFFIGFAQGWCNKYSKLGIINSLETDAHSLNFARVRVPLHNFPEFSKAFGCKPPEPKDTCPVW